MTQPMSRFPHPIDVAQDVTLDLEAKTRDPRVVGVRSCGCQRPASIAQASRCV